jgi:bifunctional non-homologous end joining protein LigD
MPDELSPQLCTLVDHAPAADGWIHEIKFDGYRFLAWKRDGEVTLITRAGNDWTHRFKPIAQAIAGLPVDNAIIDGEATIVDAAGRTSFQQLQKAIKEGHFESLAFFVFDLVYCDGFDLRATPLVERKALLARIVPPHGGGKALLRYSDHVAGGGESVERHACKLHLEGIICKRADAPYTSARTRDWLKVKCTRRQEFVIVGWTPPERSRKHFGSLLLAAHDQKGRLTYTGRVGTGFTEVLLSDMMSRMKPLARKMSPLDVEPPRAEVRGAHWIDPKLVGEVEFTEWTDEGRLRHPSFQGLREDKNPADVTIEMPKPLATLTTPSKRSREPHRRNVVKTKPSRVVVAKRSTPQLKPAKSTTITKRPAPKTSLVKTTNAKTSAGKTSPAASDPPVVQGVTITNPARIIDESSGLTKLDLVRYYDDVADLILPFIVDRPLSTVRCPTGRGGGCFFQKHLGETFSDPIKPMRVKEKNGVADYISIDSAKGLITLIQFGVIEIHPWGAKNSAIEKPDVLTFDLDPGPGVSTADVKAGAGRVREILESVGLRSFLKTSGGKGLHVIVPLSPNADWETAKSFAHAVATFMTQENPGKYIDTLSKAKRNGRIFVDYLRNGRGATSVAPYSVRARENLPVSMPIPWEALPRLTSFNAVTISDATALLKKRRKDPWADYFTLRQRLSAKAIRIGR